MTADARDAVDPLDPFVSLVDLAAAYRTGRTRPSAVVAAHLDRIARRDPTIGAFQAVYADDAMAAAEAADKAIASGHRIGPFHGIPFGLKDICELAGRTTTWGSAALTGRVSTTTGATTRRLMAAGGIVLGKTKTVEFAFGAWGTNQRMGTPRNPWDMAVARAPGGSSSGSAAAVSAGLAVCAVGTDTGGSVRLPAAFCGLAGLKTTAGWLPLDGIMPLSGALDTPGPLARSAIDALVMAEVMAGREGWEIDRDLETAGGRYAALSKGVDGLRLAALSPADREAVSPEVLARYDAALEALRSLGAVIEPFAPPTPLAALTEACGRIIAAECYANHRALLEDPAAPLDEDVRARGLGGRDVSAADYQATLADRLVETARFLEAFAPFDAFLTPTTPYVAPPVATIDQSVSPSGFTRPFNYLSMCGFATPIGLDPQGLPTSMQIAARGGDEAMALRIGAALERAFPLARTDDRAAAAPLSAPSLNTVKAPMTDQTSSPPSADALCDQSAVELRRMIGAKRISPVELLESCLARVSSVNPTVNAVVSLDAEGARAAARQAEAAVMAGDPLGPLHGIPIAIKDNRATKGLRTTHGSLLHKDDVPTADDPTVARVRAAGAIIFGKTNLPEFGAGGNTVNRVFGATCNPFDTTKTSGGSSGGAAAALATGMTPLATGSDYGGSLRTPASFCGVVGYRPSIGVAPSFGAASYFSPWGVEGPMARSLSDAMLLLSAQAGYDGRDPFSSPSVDDVAAPIAPADLSRLRIAISPDLGAAPVSSSVRALFADRTSRMRGWFAAAEDAHPDMGPVHEIFEITRGLSFVSSHRERLEKHRDLLDRNVIDNTERGLQYSLADVAWAQVEQAHLYRRWRAFFDDYDALIMPSASVPPFPHSQLFVEAIDGEAMPSYMRWLALSYATTMALAPVAALPSGLDQQGTPFGIMIAGRHGDDRKVLSIALALEAALAASPDTARPAPDLARLASNA